MAYSIDGFDLKTTFGLEVESITDLYSTPARKTKKPISQDWPNEHGEEPFLGPQDIMFQARNINIKGFMVAASKVDLETKLGDLFNLLSSEGLHTLATTHSDTTFEVYLKDKITITKMSQPSSTPVYARLAITLREPNPTLVMSNVPPVIGPKASTITTKQYVSITAQNKGCQIKYTLDGSDPSAENGISYKDKFLLIADATVKAVALDTNNKASTIAIKAFVVKPPEPVSAPLGNGVDDSSVQLYLPFNLGAKDYSEYGRSGIITEALLKTGAGEFKTGGGAYQFDGMNDYIESNVAVVTAYPFSLSAWFRSAGTATQAAVCLADKDVANIMYGFRLEADGKASVFAQNAGSFQLSSSTLSYNDDAWYHAVAIFNSNTDKRLYIDGSLIGTLSTSVTFNAAVDRYSVGRCGDSTPGDYWNGYIDEVKVWNRELQLSEIQALYNGEDTTFSSERVNQGMTTATPISLSDSLFEAQIYYTLDGSDPDDTDTLYSTPFTLPSGTTVVKAAAKHNGIYSDIMREVYIVT